MTAQQTQIFSQSLRLPLIFLPPSLRSVYYSLLGWMSLIPRWLETKADSRTEVHSLLSLTRGMKIKRRLFALL